MHLNALLDVDVVAVESTDRISVLLDLTAPVRDAGARRPPGTLQVVLDRSGSMAGERLEAARGALRALVDRLDPADRFGLAVFDDEAHVVVPAEVLGAAKPAVKQAIEALGPGGMTNLSAGYLRGIQEARRASAGEGATLLLLSDGHANAGIVEHDRLATIAAGGRAHGVTTTTVGIGLDYEEDLLAALARGGGGNHAFAADGDGAAAAVAGEVEHLLDQVVQAAHLTVRPTGEVESIHLHNALPAVAIDGGFIVELGDFHSAEERKLVLTIEVPAMAALGLATVCELELQWVDVVTLETHTVTVPVNVNVVPGDEAAGRAPNPVVRTEMAFQDAQRAKRYANEQLRRGDADAAAGAWRAAGDALEAQAAAAPAEMAGELLDEARLLRATADDAARDARRVAKQMQMDEFYKSSRRGRRR